MAASRLFDEAYAAAKAGDFKKSISCIDGVNGKGQHPEVASALLQALLQAMSDDTEGHTILHQAAWHGSIEGVTELLRRGGDADLPNAVGESALDVAIARGHEEAAEQLRRWSDAWAGWGVEELTVLACLYHSDLMGGGGFADGELYLQAAIDGERDKDDPTCHLFLRPLPCGVSLLDIARRLETPGCELIRSELDRQAAGGEALVTAPGEALLKVEEEDVQEEVLVVEAEAADVVQVEVVPAAEAAAKVEAVAAEEAAELVPVVAAPAVDAPAVAAPAAAAPAAAAVAAPPAAAPAAAEAAAEAAKAAQGATAAGAAPSAGDKLWEESGSLPDWPEDGWAPPCAGYMVCALCKGQSGPKGRWGPLHLGHPSHARYPLLVCAPCQVRHGLGPPDETTKTAWAYGVVKLERRMGYWGGYVTQMVHPSLGDIGH